VHLETVAMEVLSPATVDSANWEQQFAASLGGERARVQEFLAARRERLQQAEVQLAEQLDALAGELLHGREENEQIRDDLERRSAEVARQIQTLETLRKEFDDQAAEWEQLQQRSSAQHDALLTQIRAQQEELDRRQVEVSHRAQQLDGAEAANYQEHRALEMQRVEHAAEADQLAALRSRLEIKQSELEMHFNCLAEHREKTEMQRRRIARELKLQRTAQRKQFEQRRKELQQHDESVRAELQQQLDAVRQHEAELSAALQQQQNVAQQREAEFEAERQGLCDAGRQRESELAAELDRLRAQYDEASAELVRLAAVECRAKAAAEKPSEPSSASAAGADQEDHLRRYELAMDDVRELRARNAELQQQLADARTAPPQTRSPATGALDWEAEKLRVLAALESGELDGEEGANERAKEERLKFEDLVRKTDALLARKDGEIADLKHLLENQSCNLQSVAVGAMALGEILDGDTIVREERENLRRAQEEWREKLRQAEIVIAIDRAKLARERAQLDEKLHQLSGQMPNSAGEVDPTKPEKPARGRWLARLGLKEVDEKAKPNGNEERR
jgi:hypothetical protein